MGTLENIHLLKLVEIHFGQWGAKILRRTALELVEIWKQYIR